MNLNSRKVMVVLTCLFTMPVIAAFLLYFYAPHWMIINTSNQGKLISSFKIQQLIEHSPSSQPNSDLILDRRWHLIYITPDSCDEHCVMNLYKMRQIRLALAEKMKRVQRDLASFKPLSLQTVSKIKKNYPGTALLILNKKQYAQLIQNEREKNQVVTQGGFYLVDPLGNVLMYYPSTVQPKSIYKDLNHLLKISRIG